VKFRGHATAVAVMSSPPVFGSVNAGGALSPIPSRQVVRSNLCTGMPAQSSNLYVVRWTASELANVRASELKSLLDRRHELIAQDRFTYVSLGRNKSGGASFRF
jgi:hypothetical protein